MLVLLTLLAGCAGPAAFVPAPENHFYAQTYAQRPYQVYLPADWSPERRWPVVVYLHGGGEIGRDGVKQTQVGLGPVLHESGGTFPYVVVLPQSAGAFWAMPQAEKEVLAVLDEVVARYAGDPEKVVLTGNSMGGYGTWLIAARNPGRFAAIVPICGGILPPKLVPVPEDAPFLHEPDPYLAVARALREVPVWVFHGARDPVVPVQLSRRLVEALQEVGAEVRYSELAGVGHEAEAVAYRDPELVAWLAEKLR